MGCLNHFKTGICVLYRRKILIQLVDNDRGLDPGTIQASPRSTSRIFSSTRRPSALHPPLRIHNMAKLVTKAACAVAPSPFNTISNSKHTADTLSTLAGQLRRAIVSQCLPKLCVQCRRLLMDTGRHGKKVTLPSLESFCAKCRRVVLQLTQPTHQQSTSLSLADRVFSFMQNMYKSLSPQKERPEDVSCRTSPKVQVPKKEVPIVTRNKIDSSTIYPYLTALNRPWCRYCGVTVSSKWKSGPWGKASLCNSHGPDDQGNEHFDLHRFSSEGSKRVTPILKDFCAKCWNCVGNDSKPFKTCSGCSLSFHDSCLPSSSSSCGEWFCGEECLLDKSKRIVRGKIGFDERMPFTINILCASPEPSRKPIEPTPLIFVPRFSRVEPVQPRLKRSFDQVERELEQLEDDHCHKRHHRYEATEKNNHILRPHIMRKLFPKKAAK